MGQFEFEFDPELEPEVISDESPESEQEIIMPASINVEIEIILIFLCFIDSIILSDKLKK